jgi:hypothetical protein
VVLELVEALPPHLAVGLEPAVELHERLYADAVQPPLAGRAHADKPGVAKHSEVFGHRRLTDRQALNKCADGPLPATQLIEDLASTGLGEDLDRGLS